MLFQTQRQSVGNAKLILGDLEKSADALLFTCRRKKAENGVGGRASMEVNFLQLDFDDASLRPPCGEHAWLMAAGPLARVIQGKVKRPLSNELLFGKLASGGTLPWTNPMVS
ncbi:MAG: hypothetical protein H6707_04205 [Deltaproteobacteria bacterium]|nr:hypothetical protein [Deltaproteobacteria bacterium]